MMAALRHYIFHDRIMELEHALFFNYSDAVLKLSASVIRALHIDEVGQIWFLTHRPTQNLSEFEREFRGRLDFYKKGKDFHLQVWGKACLVVDPEEIHNALHLPEEVRQLAATSMALVKMKMDKIYYFPHFSKHPHTVDTPLHPPQPSAFFKTLQYIFKDIIPVFQSH